jgi:hypothetical protein
MTVRRVGLVALVFAGGLTAAAGCGLDLKGNLAVDDDAGGGPPGMSGEGGPGHPGSSGNDGNDGASSGAPFSGDDAGDPGNDPGNDAASPPSPDAGGQCDFTGTWATKVTINVNWVPQGLMSVIIAPGTGQIQQWVKSTRTQQGTSTTDVAVVCGISLPDFSGTDFVGGETYGVRFPNSLFDHNYLPPFSFFGSLSDRSAHAFFTTKTSAALLGITLPNANTAAWPSTVTTAVDSDMDGNPGVTVTTATGPTPGGSGVYSDFPVDVLADRANEIGIVIRQVTQLSGAATDCDHLSGAVTIPKLPAAASGKFAIDSHVVGCTLVDGGACSSAQVGFLDGTQPVFSPVAGSGQATFASVRMSSPTCADVRQALP